MDAENGGFFSESSEGLKEGVELPAGEQFVKAAQTMEDALFDVAVYPLVVDDEQVGAGTVVWVRTNKRYSSVTIVCTYRWPLPISLPELFVTA